MAAFPVRPAQDDAVGFPRHRLAVAMPLPVRRCRRQTSLENGTRFLGSSPCLNRLVPEM
jgi:hypothetical protein